MKQAVIVIPDTTNKALENWTASCVITSHLVAALRSQEVFRTADHLDCLREGRTAVRKRSVLLAEETLTDTIEGDL